MARATWPLLNGRPRVQINIATKVAGLLTPRDLVADSGAGSLLSSFEVILNERDCLRCRGRLISTVQLGGAYTGAYRLYRMRIQIPQLGFNEKVDVVGVPSTPTGFDGLAGFRLLNRFSYGNIGDPGQFGLEHNRIFNSQSLTLSQSPYRTPPHQ